MLKEKVLENETTVRKFVGVVARILANSDGKKKKFDTFRYRSTSLIISPITNHPNFEIN